MLIRISKEKANNPNAIAWIDLHHIRTRKRVKYFKKYISVVSFLYVSKFLTLLMVMVKEKFD